MRIAKIVAPLLAGAVITVLVGSSVRTQQTAAQPAGDWPMYRHDYSGTGYSPLTQITTRNVSSLTQAWTYNLQSDTGGAAASGKSGPAVNSQATPIAIGGIIYVPTENGVVALDAESGKERWRHVISGGSPSRRGVAYWPGESKTPRIIFTAGRRLIALDAAMGRPVPSFGKDGEVDMVVPYNSVPLVYKNVVIVGANNPPGGVRVPGNARAFDALTGAKIWEFSSVAQPGSVGHDTWEGDSWKGRAGANAWPFYFTMDEQRGLVYLPLASPIPGGYGGDRKGANLYGNSVVAVDIQSGAYKWHFQTIHHDLWDADPPAPPGLFEVVRNGRSIPAMALTTKSGYMYILNRETGRPIFGVEERPVAGSDVPGEAAFPTQPIPVKPPPMARTSYTSEDLVTAADTTPEHAAACDELIASNGGVYNAGPFTPWKYRDAGATTPLSLVFPGGLGGANWGGTASDPRSGYVFVATQDVGALGWIRKAQEGASVTYEKTAPRRATFDVLFANESWPCQKPPWGRLTLVNATTGDIAWQIPLGITEQLPPGRQNTGRPVLAGPIVSAGGVLFIASTDDNRFRAFDAKSGKQLWVTSLERRGNADPITYQARNGKQYVAIVATDTLKVYSLP
jgi:quinoprotein glucose dehydrogenase